MFHHLGQVYACKHQISKFCLCESTTHWGAQQVHGAEPRSTTAVLMGMMHINWTIETSWRNMSVV